MDKKKLRPVTVKSVWPWASDGVPLMIPLCALMLRPTGSRGEIEYWEISPPVDCRVLSTIGSLTVYTGAGSE
ncbi:hypothetical protein HDG34_006572 [Paraburkholderia sp. HC6.4b]|nr:hypothetical protein [Paraburkholderia sp. HC6.4b]MBB5454518.1 hypothetical protein [Paraburkholderia sp. Kb1A]